jgi:hypothetical protein
MGWQADSNPGPGEVPGQGQRRPAPHGGFGHGGAWAGAAPSAGLAVALEAAAGPEGRYDGADTDALVGIVRQWAAVESWAAAGKLGALRAMTREDGEGMDHPNRPHLHPRTMALHRMTVPRVWLSAPDVLPAFAAPALAEFVVVQAAQQVGVVVHMVGGVLHLVEVLAVIAGRRLLFGPLPHDVQLFGGRLHQPGQCLL